MKTFNNTKPTPGRKALWRTVEIGWEHTVDGDDIVITAGEDGEAIARSYRVPATVTSAQLLDAVKTIGPDRLELLAAGGGIDAAVELLGALIGSETILAVAGDPTVTSEEFLAFVADLAEGLGLGEALPAPPDFPTKPAKAG